MRVYQLIQILCRLDPETPVLLSLDGFPATSKEVLDSVYDDYDDHDGKDSRRVLLTTSKVNYKE